MARRQLPALGITGHTIDHWLRTGRLHQLYRGVYAVGHPRIGLHARWLAAVYACGHEAVLSHRSAAHLWGFRRTSRGDIDVTTAQRGRHGHERVTLHRVRTLHPTDRTTHEGIPTTSVARTLLDLAEVVRPNQLRRAVEESERLQLFDLHAINELRARSPGRHGLKPLNAVLADKLDAPHTKGELEGRFYDFCREQGLPIPQFNVPLLEYEADAFWPPTVVVELDSYAYHWIRTSHEADRVKQLALQAAEYLVLRITWRMLDDPAPLAAQIRTVLSQAASLSRLKG